MDKTLVTIPKQILDQVVQILNAPVPTATTMDKAIIIQAIEKESRIYNHNQEKD